ncbi:MAG: AmmeMemoRadiSam system protein B [Nitrososphaerales archaeon]
MRVRKPAVAGSFYPAERNELLRTIEDCFLHEYGPRNKPPSSSSGGKRILALVCPHAGYEYSGPVAAHSYYVASSLRPDLVVMVGPNHFPRQNHSGIATMRECSWETPLGNVDVNSESAEQAVKSSGIVDYNDDAHSEDHCLEVQLPMLQYIYSHRFKILPIILRMQDIKTALDVGKAIAEVAKKENALLIASSDFTHYEPNLQAYKKDNELIKAILELDIARYYKVLERLHVTACGYGAIASIMTAAKILGASRGELLKYATSGDIAGNKGSVVGYASILFTSS